MQVFWISIVTVILVWILQVTRLGILIKLTHLEPKNRTSQTTMGNLLHLTSQVAHCFGHAPMLHGIYLFCRYLKDKSNTGKCCKSEQHPFLNHCKIQILLVLLLVVHLGISMSPHALLISWKEDNVVSYNESPEKGNVYAALALIDHFYAFLIRSAMALMTLFVIYAWKNAEENVNTEIIGKLVNANIVQQLAESDIVKIMQILMNTYHSTGERVNAVQNIFQGWFVIKWMVYFINIAGHSILTVEIVFDDDTRGDEYEKHKLAFVLTQLFYNFFAFFFLFVCGSWMNRYHTNYCKYQEALQRKLLSNNHNNYILLLQSTNNLISEVPEYQFLPTIFSIDFPLNSPGYILTMLLALFVFIANFVTQYR